MVDIFDLILIVILSTMNSFISWLKQRKRDPSMRPAKPLVPLVREKVRVSGGMSKKYPYVKSIHFLQYF